MKPAVSAVLTMVVVALLLSRPTSMSGQGRVVVVIKAAPLYLIPDASRTPLQTVREGTTVNVLGVEGDWLQVEVENAQLGGMRVGYIEARFTASLVTRKDASKVIGPEKSSNTVVVPTNGMYVVADGRPIRLNPETYKQDTHMNPLIFIPFATREAAKFYGRIPNPHSPLRVPAPQEFMFIVVEGYSIVDYRLLKLEEKGNRREFRITTIGSTWKNSKNDLDGKNAVALAPEEIDSRTWRFQLNLPKGEYGFLSPVKSQRSPDLSSTVLGSIFTFGVD